MCDTVAPPVHLLLQARSLVQLLQQTQPIKWAVERAQRKLASEAVRKGIPPATLYPAQMEAVK
jgi:hypothetical protein